ncbi:MAG: hypothetical protein QOF02_863 [Blastocatellia bacterium]|jgi:hypothetical protein|nr:hypothetical protein [Blastocatellia bacterium]
MAAEATRTLTHAPSVPEKITNAQTVCNRRNEKNKLCNGHIKQLSTGGEEAEKHLRGDDVLFKCQTCGTLYMGPPLGHVRDVDKQQRFVEKELAALLQAAGGSLPAIRKNEKGVFVLAEPAAQHAPAAGVAAPATSAAKPAAAAPAAAKPAAAHMKAPSETTLGPIPGASGPVPGETPEQKLARLKSVAAEAKRRKALLESEEGAALLLATPAAAPAATTKTTATPAASAQAKTQAPTAASLGPIAGASGPVEGETPEQKLARLKAVVAEAKRRKALLEGDEAAGGEAQHTKPTAASTSGTNSSAEADAHRPAAEAQAATGMASAAPLSAAAATASPVGGPETPADLAPDTVPNATVAATESSDLGPIAGASGPVPGETPEEKIARLKAVVAEAKRRKALSGGE